MLKVLIAPVTPFQQNCSIVWCDETMEGTAVDPGGDFERLKQAIAEQGIKVTKVLLTHGHVDHTGSAAELRESTGAPVQAGAGDAAVIRGEAEMAPPVLQDTERPILERRSASLPDTAPPVPVDRELVDADVLDFGGGAEILAIPGHTKGSIAIHLPRHGVLFTGDTVANVGAVMLGTFNHDRAQTIASLRRLAALDVETARFGHGEPIGSGAGDRIREVADQLSH